MPVKHLAPLPPVIVNAVVVALVLGFSQCSYSCNHGFGRLVNLLPVMIGYPLMLLLEEAKPAVWKVDKFYLTVGNKCLIIDI